MSTGHENTESIFRLFRVLKLDISDAIKDLFPFLEVLRDNNVISDKQYDDFQESRGNEKIVPKVVYKVLKELEEKNDLKALGLLFCKQNMEAYPDLERIFEGFKNVLPQDQLCFEENDRRDPNLQLNLEQGPAQESLMCSPPGPTHPILNSEDFRRPELPVTCGNARGTLYVKKFAQGIYEKSILTENGEWLTLREFEIRGDREKSKSWRQSIYSQGWTLGCLIKGRILPDSPRTKGQRENRTSPE